VLVDLHPVDDLLFEENARSGCFLEEFDQEGYIVEYNRLQHGHNPTSQFVIGLKVVTISPQ
jgi:hypothetical protein